MPHKNQYAIVNNVIDDDMIDLIIRTGEKKKRTKAVTQGGKTSYMRHIRNSTISWLENDSDNRDPDLDKIYETIDKCVLDMAKTMELTHWNITDRQAYQYTSYTKGQYYDWHRDTFDDPYLEGPWSGNIRKLSFTLLLNERDKDYEGGNFELDLTWRYGPDTPWKRHFVLEEMHGINKGSLIVFQSSLWHRVTPVKRGKRKSLVGWYIGPPFS